jgi:peptidylprolyl isomerase
MSMRYSALVALVSFAVSTAACRKSEFAGPPADAQKTLSGLASKVIKPGTGTTHPTAASVVTVNYTGWKADGTQFDSSESHGGPATFPLGNVIPGWTEGVQLMTEGEKRRLWIPGNIAFDRSPDPNAPKGPVVFDVELVNFTTPPPPPPAPDDVAAPPADAKKTASGLAFKILKPGTGKIHPTPAQEVTVQYSVWTTEGRLIDSSVTRGKPATFKLGDMIKGWIEGIPLMVVGETRRFWVPGKLAYEGNPQRPQGMLVFDVELLDIK